MNDLQDIRAYHADTAFVTSSMLRTLDQGPRVYEAKYVLKTMPQQTSPAMEFGTALHAAVLEPELFAKDYVECKFPDRRKKDYREWKESLPEGVTVLTSVDMERIRQCQDSLQKNPFVATVLDAEGQVETPIVWTDPETGVDCKFRPDKITRGVVLDVKTTQSIKQQDFAKSVANFGYHLQAAHYLAGAECSGSGKCLHLLAVVETQAPFRCRAYRIDDQAIDLGFEQRFRLLEDLKRRQDAGDWKEEGETDLIDISLPDWSLRQWRMN